jgi:hypothetical protein
MSSKDHGRGSKGKSASSASQSKSPNNTSNGDDAAATTPTTAHPAPARGGKRVKEEHDDHDDKHHDGKKKSSSRKQKLQLQPATDPVSEVEKDEEGSGGSGDDESGPTRCICELDGRKTGQTDRRRLTHGVWFAQTTTRAGSW